MTSLCYEYIGIPDDQELLGMAHIRPGLATKYLSDKNNHSPEKRRKVALILKNSVKINKKTKKSLKISNGGIVTFDVLEWFNEGWEFGHPTVMLRPIVRIEENHGAETLIENICIDLACGYELDYIGESELHEFHWRGWDIKCLTRRFNEALTEKRFPKAGFRATRKVINFCLEDGHLGWENITEKTLDK